MSASGNDRKGDRPEPDQDPPAAAGGVLGNLPRNRPAVRSPRRADRKPPDPAAPAQDSARAGEEPAGREPAASGAAPPPPASKATQVPPASGGEGTSGGHSPPAGDLESLARGGIAIAGGAASLGLRIAGRAAAALRDAVERR